MVDDILVSIVKALYIIRSDIEDITPVMPQSELTCTREVLCIDKLVTVLAVAYEPELFIVIYEFIKDCKKSQTALVHDGGAPEDDRVYLVLCGHKDLLAFKLGSAVDLNGGRLLFFCYGIIEIPSPEAVGRREYDLADTVLYSHVKDVLRAVHIGAPELLHHLAFMREHCGKVENSVELILGKSLL